MLRATGKTFFFCGGNASVRGPTLMLYIRDFVILLGF